jgi:hypothetical protein
VSANIAEETEDRAEREPDRASISLARKVEFAMSVLSLRRYEPDQVQRVFARIERDLSQLLPAPLGTALM